MKRYIVFMGADYYPRQAWRDYKSTFDLLDEAKEFVLGKNGYDWYQIVDLTTGTVVCS